VKFTTDFNQSQALATIRAKLGEVQNVVFLATGKQLYEGIFTIHRHAFMSITQQESSGRSYRRGKNHDIEHVASEPGYPPNSDTGRLAQSIAFDVDVEKLEAVVGTNVQYGAFLEMGTKNIAARPWLFPAFEAHKEEIKANLASALRDAIRKAGA
jgi:phage gpG-like protein